MRNANYDCRSSVVEVSTNMSIHWALSQPNECDRQRESVHSIFPSPLKFFLLDVSYNDCSKSINRFRPRVGQIKDSLYWWGFSGGSYPGDNIDNVSSTKRAHCEWIRPRKHCHHTNFCCHLNLTLLSVLKVKGGDAAIGICEWWVHPK